MYTAETASRDETLANLKKISRYTLRMLSWRLNNDCITRRRDCFAQYMILFSACGCCPRIARQLGPAVCVCPAGGVGCACYIPRPARAPAPNGDCVCKHTTRGVTYCSLGTVRWPLEPRGFILMLSFPDFPYLTPDCCVIS